MFWGLIIEPGKKYSQTVENSFHISKATLDLSNVTDEDVSLLLDYEGQQEYILCHLNKGNKQESLDLNFQAGDSISLFSHGQASIHLSGYLLGDEDDEDMTLGDMMEEEEEMDEEDEEMDDEEEADLRKALQARSMKRAQESNGKGKPQKRGKFEDDEAEEEEGEEEDEDEEEDGEEEGEEEEEEASPPPKQQQQQQKKLTKAEKKKNKKQQQQTAQQGTQQGKPQQQQQQKKEDAQGKKNPAQAGQNDAKPATPNKRTLAGGLVVQDLKPGSGREAKNGDLVAVYYTGRLQKNGKQFDKTIQGPGFKFKLGAGKVIKGWDLGLVGMKVGGKRQLTIPAHLAYGAGGSPPQIPPNSTLLFDVELKALN